MKEINQSEKIIDLLSSKKFESLTNGEKSFVLAEMDQDEYNQLFELHHQLNATIKENSFSPSENRKNKLIAAFDAHHSSERNKKNNFHFLYLKVPLYQPIAAALMVLLFLAAIYFLSDFSSITNERIVIKYLTDTIYVKTDFAKQTDTLYNTGKSKSVEENAPVNNSSASAQKNNNAVKSMAVTLSRSIKDDSDLKQFMVSF